MESEGEWEVWPEKDQEHITEGHMGHPQDLAFTQDEAGSHGTF